MLIGSRSFRGGRAARPHELAAAERVAPDGSRTTPVPPADHSALMGAAVRSVGGAVRTVAVSAELAASEAHEAAATAASVADHVGGVSVSVGEFSASVEEISRNAAEAADVVREAAGASGEAMQLVERLSESSRQIGSMLDLVTSIAAQTDLLALNATIEAARAGEVGRGFAVVAAEVKELARATSAATREIGDTVSRLRSDAAAAGAAMARIGGLVEQFEGRHGSIAAAVEEQAVTTRQIGSALETVAIESDQLATTVSSLAGAVYDVTFAASKGRAAATSIETQLVEAGRIEPSTEVVDPLVAAIAAHSDWKARLSRAIDTSGEGLVVSQIGRDDVCAFGKWLHGEIDPRRRGSSTFDTVRQLHAEFHRHAAQIVTLAQTGQTSEAKAAITIGSPFAATSAQLTSALHSWR